MDNEVEQPEYYPIRSLSIINFPLSIKKRLPTGGQHILSVRP